MFLTKYCQIMFHRSLSKYDISMETLPWWPWNKVTLSDEKFSLIS